jgi:hypothetical protein
VKQAIPPNGRHLQDEAVESRLDVPLARVLPPETTPPQLVGETDNPSLLKHFYVPGVSEVGFSRSEICSEITAVQHLYHAEPARLLRRRKDPLWWGLTFCIPSAEYSTHVICCTIHIFCTGWVFT